MYQELENLMDYSKYCIDIFENSLPSNVCKDIIDRFEKDTRKVNGGVGYGDGSTAVDHSLKKCTELNLSTHPEWKDIDELLFKIVGDKVLLLRDKYSGLNKVNAVSDTGYRIKKYLNNGTEYFNWHIDQSGKAQGNRYLIFMWYLNTVKQGGETEFKLQDISVKPVEGRLITFPPYWTHEHRALPPVDVAKYVMCSWIIF